MAFNSNSIDSYIAESFDEVFAIIGDLATALSDDGRIEDLDRATTLELLPHAIQMWVQFQKWEADNGI